MSECAGCRQYAAAVLLAADPADPDMCGHLWPGVVAGGADGLAAGLAGLDEVAVDEVCDVRAAEDAALAVLSPNARVAPSAAAPTAVPIRGLVILIRFSFRWCSAGRPGRAG